MSDEKLLWTAEIDDKASAVLDAVAGSIEDIAKATEKAADSTKKSKDATKESTSAQKDSVEEAGKLYHAFGLLKTIYDATIGTIKELIAVQNEQLEIDRKLTLAFEQHGIAATEASVAMEAAAARFAKTQQKTIFGDEDQARALTSLLSISNEVTDAYDALTIGIDAAAYSGQSLNDTTNAMTEAQQGNIDSLHKLGLLRLEEVKNINRVADASKRAELAMKLVEERTRGAAEAADPMSVATAQLGNDFGDLKQSLGSVALAFSEVTLRFTNYIAETSGGEFSVSNLAYAFSGFADALIETGDGIAYLWDEWVHGGERANQAARDARQKLLDQIKKEDAALMDGLMSPQKLTAGMSDVMIALLEEAGKELEKQDAEDKKRKSESGKQAAQRRAEEMKASVERQALLAFDVDLLYAADEVSKIRLARDREILSIQQQKLPKAEEALRISLEQQKAENEIGRLNAAELADIEKRNMLAVTELGILTAKDGLSKATLIRERELAALELKSVTDEERALGLAQVEAVFNAELGRLEQARVDARKESEREAHDARMAQLDEEMERQRNLFSVVQYGMAGIGGMELGGLVGELGQITEQMERMAAAGAGSGEAFAAGLGLASQAVGGFADSVINDTEKAAFVKGLFESASAAAAYASLNIPMGIAHTTAAASFFAVAGGAGPTASKPSVSATSSSASSRAASPDFEQAIHAQKRAYLEALREHERDGRQTTYVFDQSGSNFFEREPASMRRTRQTLEGDSRLRVP